MGSQIQHYEGHDLGLTQWRAPEQVLAEAKLAADALTKVISLKKNPVKFNGETYLEFEDWQTCAKFYGVTAKVERTTYVEYGSVRGFEAVAVAIDRNGMEISRAESLCLDDEANWGMVAQYEWQDELDENGKKIWDENKKRYRSKKVEVGKVAKPLFQLKSMSQTRACSKVLRQVFSWIVVLAGYRPTPAEEMTGNEQPFEEEPQGRKPVQQPSRASDKKKAELAQAEQKKADDTEKITGVIESMKEGKEGAVWVVVEKKMVVIEGKFVDDSLRVGEMFSAKTQRRHSEKLKDNGFGGDFWAVLAILESPKVVDAEVVKDDSHVENPSEPAKEAETVQDLFDAKQVQTAASLPEGSGKKPGTIGSKRAQRLYALINQNKVKTGWSEEEAKRMLQALPNPITSMSDLEAGYYEQFERMATGETDWKQFWEE
jgi:hypothetical protein